LEDKGYTKINYQDVSHLTNLNNIIVWSQAYAQIEFTRLMKSGDSKRCVFNHHPQITKLCHKLQLHKLVEDFKLENKLDYNNFFLPTFALNKVEDAVKLLSLPEDVDTMWIEKNFQEFTQKHTI